MKKVKNNKNNQNKKITVIVCVVVILAIIVSAIAWITRDKTNGVFSPLGFKMNGENVLSLTVDIGDGKQEYLVPFSEYRAVYLYYANRISSVIQYDEENFAFATTAEKSAAVKEKTEDMLVEYYSLVSLSEKLGIGLTESDRKSYREEYDQVVSDYAATLTDDVKYKGSKDEHAAELYAEALGKLGMTPDYFEFNYYMSLLTSRIKAYVAENIEETINEGYFGYKQVYVEYTKGDSADERAAFDSITAALSEIENGADFDSVAEKYSDSSDAIYFDIYQKIVDSTANETVGITVAEMVKSLEYDECSGIMSGENGETYAYYSIIKRVKLTKDFVCSDNTTAQKIYAYPYCGAGSYSTAYSEYIMYMSAYEQNMQIVPVSDAVYKRIAINTLY